MFGYRLGILLVGVGWLTVSCSETPSPTPTPGNHTANQWIFEQMAEHYLYNERLQSLADTDYSLSSQAFFTSLLSTNPDDNDGKHPHPVTGKDYFYSYMNAGQSTRVIGSNVFSYGIEYQLYQFDDETALLRVLYVARGSVAEQAGVRRGDWISKLGDEAVSSANYRRAQNGGSLTLTLGQRDYNASGQWTWCEGSPRTVSLSSATLLENSPVYEVEGPDQLGMPGVGYLVYNEFNTGPGGYEDKSFDNELKEAFADLKRQNVQELILDLRYNAGGYTECARLLGSLIVPEMNLGKVFAINKYNQKRKAAGESPQTSYFLTKSEVGSANLNLSRIWVIIGLHTASASELLINSLSPYMDVVTVGSTSEGKNVGMYEIPNSQYGLSLFPVTFQSYNSLDESDYKNGFTPRYPMDELFTLHESYLPMKDLGDPQEMLLSYVLSLLGKNDLQTRTLSRNLAFSAASAVPHVTETRSSIDDRPLQGMLEPMPESFAF